MDDLPNVVIVDDEILVLEMIEEALHEGGFKVGIASSGEDAIKLLDEKTGELRALVTDVNLGPDRLSGWKIARHARELNPKIAVVYMTGDSGADWTSQGVPQSILLGKPFAPAQLVTAVAQLLNKPPRSD